MNRPHRNVGLGIVVGLAFAVVYSAVATLLYAFGAGSSTSGDPLPGLPLLILIYLGGGMLGGAAVGWLMPYSRTRLGAIIVGAVGALPFFAGLALIDDSVNVPASVISALLLGGILGYRFLYKAQ